ncbi:hypothetical protein Scep_009098 [Stephania cephalantha]|uniref:Uncharacterized protein n=1 Tax=Stephania cephalantha TaxID=152367 RepID=A0AAP0PCT0_9MAGN
MATKAAILLALFAILIIMSMPREANGRFDKACKTAAIEEAEITGSEVNIKTSPSILMHFYRSTTTTTTTTTAARDGAAPRRRGPRAIMQDDNSSQEPEEERAQEVATSGSGGGDDGESSW